jgi:hypothetical protein
MGHPGEKSPWSNEADYCHHCGGYHEGRCPYQRPRLVWPVLLYLGGIVAVIGFAAWVVAS